MSTGRHAKKRAAQAEERLLGEQEAMLAKEEAKKGVMEKDVESQRIATMRARFGGQAPDSAGGAQPASAQGVQGSPTADSKYSTPKPLTKRSSNNPMRQTIMGMMLDDGDGV